MSKAQLAVDQGNWDSRSTRSTASFSFDLDDSAFTADEVRPWQMALKIQRSLNLQQGAESMDRAMPRLVRARRATPKSARPLYDPANDDSRNVTVGGTEEIEWDSSESRTPARPPNSTPWVWELHESLQSDGSPGLL